MSGSGFQRILVVCVGNICRSPVAAEMLRQIFSASEVRSVGLAPAQGKDVHPLSRQVALEQGLQIPVHSARRLTLEDCRWADIILVMERWHLSMLQNMASYCRGKTFLLGAPCQNIEVPDPYGRSLSEFQATHELLAKCTKSWRTMI